MKGVAWGVCHRRPSRSYEMEVQPFAKKRKEMEVQPDAVRDWSELPLDVLALVFAKLGAVEVLMGAGLVCHSWLEAAKVPSLWRYVDMEHHEVLRGKKKKTQDVLCAMAKAAVDRSSGELEVFAGSEFVTDDLLKYIAERSSSLKSLSLDYCNVSNEAFTELIIKLPLLEELLISLCPFVDGDAYEIASRACAQLKRLMLRQGSYGGEREGPLGIEFMHELRYLTLVGSDITTEELVAIIDGCPHLERLCVRNCCNIVVDGALRAKCSRIKTLILPTLQCRRIQFHPDDGIFTDKFDDWRSA
ncbi:putative F-box/LRR-repeat protein 23 [Lolium rigidum]|uniref:putative F-box/LRR-repeat protein 23 n=1 Tax=Lolium rigidum TaxID=89674 RepID=UPI001F5D1FA6|nr:putative F-box/LRR-repeat protein 23 [Lolium rigidum]XP_047078637.1 putative F-box/LRR-repeat protein 23 [Lolium rigidum]